MASPRLDSQRLSKTNWLINHRWSGCRARGTRARGTLRQRRPIVKSVDMDSTWEASKATRASGLVLHCRPSVTVKNMEHRSGRKPVVDFHHDIFYVCIWFCFVLCFTVKLSSDVLAPPQTNDKTVFTLNLRNEQNARMFSTLDSCAIRVA